MLAVHVRIALHRGALCDHRATVLTLLKQLPSGPLLDFPHGFL